MAVRADLARPAGAVMVIHENRGLVPHIEDVTRRVALEGFHAFAPDFLSDQGGTPADENAARDLIAKVDYNAIVAEALGVIQMLKRVSHATGKVGTTGFCWGGGLVDRVAVAAGTTLAAAVPWICSYSPDPLEAVKVHAAMLKRTFCRAMTA